MKEGEKNNAEFHSPIILILMSRTTYRTLLLGTFLVPLLFLGFYLRGEKVRTKFLPDTQSYVLSSPYRTHFYPTFLNLFLKESLQTDALAKSDPTNFERISAIQKALFLLSTLILLIVCHHLLPFSHLLLFIFSWVFLRTPFSTTLVQAGWIMPEGLSLSWITLVLALSFWLLSNERLLWGIAFTLLLFVGVELSPRFLCFAPLLLIPRRRLILTALFLALVLSKSFYNYSTRGTFSPSSLNGIYTIGNSLRHLRTESLEYFTSPKERVFLTKALAANDRRLEPKHNDWLTWGFATRLYRETFPERFSGLVKGKDVLHMNAFYAGIFPKLVIKDSTFRMEWLSLSLKTTKHYFQKNGLVNGILFLLAIASLLAFWQFRLPLLLLPVSFWLCHLGNVILTIPFAGIVERYFATTEMLVIPAAFAFSLFLWEKAAFWILTHLPAFNRRSITLENSEAG